VLFLQSDDGRAGSLNDAVVSSTMLPAALRKTSESDGSWRPDSTPAAADVVDNSIPLLLLLLMLQVLVEAMRLLQTDSKGIDAVPLGWKFASAELGLTQHLLVLL